MLGLGDLLMGTIRQSAVLLWMKEWIRMQLASLETFEMSMEVLWVRKI